MKVLSVSSQNLIIHFPKFSPQRKALSYDNSRALSEKFFLCHHRYDAAENNLPKRKAPCPQPHGLAGYEKKRLQGRPAHWDAGA